MLRFHDFTLQIFTLPHFGNVKWLNIRPNGLLLSSCFALDARSYNAMHDAARTLINCL